MGAGVPPSSAHTGCEQVERRGASLVMSQFSQPLPFWISFGSLAAALVVVGVVAFAGCALLYAFGKETALAKKIGNVCFATGIGTLVFAMVAHLSLILTKQYSFQYVWTHTSNELPFIYRLSAAWAGQEGSFLLWAAMTGIIGAIVVRWTGKYRRWYLVSLAGVLACLMGILAYESPFRLITITPELMAALPAGVTMVLPPDGQGLNPSLVSPWMVIHPWIIFAGFGSLGALFAWSVSAAVSADWDGWAKAVRPVVILSMSLIGLGLVFGGVWAYETLGWGGFWAWDPVENVALVPWLLSIVFAHGLYIQNHRHKWTRFNLVMGALPFLSFAWGTLLTRSGALTAVSVHSFARMEEGAHGIMFWLVRSIVLIVLFGGGFVAARKIRAAEEGSDARAASPLSIVLVAVAFFIVAAIVFAVLTSAGEGRSFQWSVYSGFLISLVVGLAAFLAGVLVGKAAAPAVASGREEVAEHRTKAIAIGMALVAVPGVLAAIGSAVPLFATIVSKKPSVVEEGTYNRSLGAFLVLILIVVGIAPFMGWTATKRERIARVLLSSGIGLVLAVASVFVLRKFDLTRPDGVPMKAQELVLYEAIIAAGLFAVVANAVRLFERIKAKTGNPGPFLAHAGVALVLLGIVVSRAFGRQQTGIVAVGEPATVIGAQLSVPSEPSQTAMLKPGNKVPFKLEWAKRDYTLSPVVYEQPTAMGSLQPVTRPDIRSTPFYDLYLSVADMVKDYVDPVRFGLGDTKAVGDFMFTLASLQQQTPSTAVATFNVRNSDGETRTFRVQRGTADGTSDPVPFADFVGMRLDSADVASGSVVLSTPYERPVFPVELMFRPMTVLVWIGALATMMGMVFVYRRK